MWMAWGIVLLAPAVVFAQAMVPVPREVPVISKNPQIEGKDGFSGNVMLYMGYDTNISYGSGEDGTAETQYETAVPGLSMSLIPGIRWVSPQLNTDKRETGKLHYGAELRGIYRQYYTSSKGGIYNDPRFGAHLGAVVFYSPSPSLHFQVYNIFDRFSEPHYLFRDTFTMSWDQNQLGVVARIVPNDGLFETVLRYNMGLTYFEDSSLSTGSKLEHNIQLRASYKFLPSSHLWIVGTYDMNHYFEFGDLRNSTPVKVLGGVSTPLWTDFSLSVGGGYGWGLYASGPSPSSWLAFTGLQYSVSSRLKLAFLYNHTFEDSVLGSYSDQHNFSLQATVPFGQRLLFTGSVGYRHLEYFSVVHGSGGSGPDTRVDDVIFANLSLSYKLRHDLLLRAQYKLMSDQTPYRATTGEHPLHDPEATFPLAIQNNPSFVKNEIFLTLDWHF